MFHLILVVSNYLEFAFVQFFKSEVWHGSGILISFWLAISFSPLQEAKSFRQ